MNMTLRALRPEEYSTICSWAIAEQWPGLVKGQLLTVDEFPAILSLPGHFSFAMSKDGCAATGFGQIWQSPNGATNLIRILIDPAMRGQGYGKRLCALLLSEALRMPDVRQVKLRVSRQNLSAIAVYRSIGFCELESESNTHALAMAYGAWAVVLYQFLTARVDSRLACILGGWQPSSEVMHKPSSKRTCVKPTQDCLFLFGL